MEPQTPDARLRWLAAALEAIVLQMEALAAEFRVALTSPLPLDRYERRLVRKIRLQLEALAEDADFIRDQLAALRARPGGGA
jgi:hypothetical protein